jgi:hypothetical protein
MGLLDKFIVVEKEEPTLSTEDIRRQLAEARGNTYVEPQEVELPEGVNLADLITIETVYENFGLTDMDKSIFKVEELSKALPDTLTTEVKRAAVLGILPTVKLSVEDLVVDAQKRLDALNATVSGFSTESANIVSEAESKIAQLEAEIDAQKQIINDRKVLQEQVETLTQDESNKIKKNVNFIQPA